MNSLSLSMFDWLVGGGALVLNILAGLWLAMRARQSGSSDEFFLAGRRLTWPIVGASLLATNIGAEHMVGLCGDAYRYGFCAGAIELTAGILDRHRGGHPDSLLPQEPGVHDSRVPRTALSEGSPPVLLGHDAGDLHRDQDGLLSLCRGAGAAGHAGSGTSCRPSIALAVTTAIITMIGGFAAVAYTDAIHAPIMILGSALVLLIGLYKVGRLGRRCARRRRTRSVPDAMHIHKPYDDPVYPFWGHHTLRRFTAARFIGASTR